LVTANTEVQFHYMPKMWRNSEGQPTLQMTPASHFIYVHTYELKFESY